MTTMREIPAELGYGGAHLNQTVLREVLVELQEKVTEVEAAQTAAQARIDGMVSPDGIRTTVVSGAGTDTDIAVSGILATHTLLGVVKLDFTLTDGTPNTRTWDADDLRAEASVTSDGNIQLGTTDTSGAILTVTWLNE